MDTAKQAIEVLAGAEKRLRELVGTAAAGGDYKVAEQVMVWARALGELVCDPSLTQTSPVPSRELPPARRSRRTPAKGDYPRFFRRGDNLIKIGWSKKEKAEYEHKAPRRVVDALTGAITRRSGNGKLFTVEDLLPLKDPQDGGEMPGYQVYVALAWFKSTGLVKQHGRQGYSLKRGWSMETALNAWELLKAQSGANGRDK